MIYSLNNIEIQYNKSVSTETILPLFRCDSNHGRIVFICMILLEIKKTVFLFNLFFIFKYFCLFFLTLYQV